MIDDIMVIFLDTRNVMVLLSCQMAELEKKEDNTGLVRV